MRDHIAAAGFSAANDRGGKDVCCARSDSCHSRQRTDGNVSWGARFGVSMHLIQLVMQAKSRFVQAYRQA